MIYFEDFYREIYPGRKPFPWQCDLADTLIRKGWDSIPEIGAPTSAGKTTVIVIAIHNLACYLMGDTSHRAPLRICLAVDRRLIVDEGFQSAFHIAEKLRDAKSGILKQVADALRSTREADEADCLPLMVGRMRGAIYRDESWVRDPRQPVVLTSTVAQISSRLLMRGYGVGSKSRAVQAGLLANDALILLDEVHLSEPFQQLAFAIKSYRDRSKFCRNFPFHVVPMSATLNRSSPTTFRISEADRQHPILQKRLGAAKPTLLCEIKENGDDAIAMASVQCALQLTGELDCSPNKFGKKIDKFIGKHPHRKPKVVFVFVNRKRRARLAEKLLRKQSKNGLVYLMFGAVRPFDRNDLLKQLMPYIGAEERSQRLVSHGLDCQCEICQQIVYVVATQTLQVGANVICDARVSDACPFKDEIQRAGRQDRFGYFETTLGVYLITSEVQKKNDLIYGSGIINTYEWLKKHAVENVIDFGVNAMEALMGAAAQADPEWQRPLNGHIPVVPTLLPAHLDLLSQTHPNPEISQDISAFSSGQEPSVGEVQVVWRNDLTAEWLNKATPEQIKDYVACIPPLSSEAMSISPSVAKKLLNNELQSADESDVEFDQLDELTSQTPRKAICWRGRNHVEIIDATQVLPSDLLIVPSEYGGCDKSGFSPDTDYTSDIRSLCSMSDGCFPLLRWHPGTNEKLNSLLQIVKDSDREDQLSAVNQALPLFTNHLKQHQPIFGELISKLQAATTKKSIVLEFYECALGMSVCLRDKRMVRTKGLVELTPQEQSDTQCSPREVTLLDHSTAVSDRAFRFATKVLPKIYSQVLKIVGRFHDVGKNDRRTQGFFRGSAIWDHSLPALAKSLRRYSQKEDAEIRKQTKFLLGLRHEALSAALFQQGVKDGKINLDGCEKYIDLILYLLWTHHGHRPLLPPPPPEADAIKVSTPPNFPGVAGEISISSDHGLEKFDCPCPEIFCQLQSEYGWWGLAYLEAFIRLADQWESAK